ncbi:MAG: hypothetical protein H7Z14_08840 [Anaerolineae bacterium]|nr:hypothetical protein [Phycisphaerae bacterium]
MKNTDPSSHQLAERQMIEHVTRLLDDPRLVLDTTRGRRAITALLHNAPAESDRGVELKRTMSEMNVPDRALQESMPIGKMIDVPLKQKRLFWFSRSVGHLRVVCASPTRDLIAGKETKAMDSKDVEAFLRTLPPPVANVPMTVVMVSTSGFTIEARGVAERTAQRTVILAEPNGAGGWSVYGPPETKALVDLFDPEAENEKRQRIRGEIEAARVELLTSGIVSDKIAAKTQLPLQLVEAEVKSFAKANPGLAAKRLDGRVVLFREGSAPISTSSKSDVVSNASSAGGLMAGGSGMPLIDRIRSLFARKGETEKKVAFLSERRAALSQQRERAYEEITALEGKDDELREQFKNARAPLTKKRVTQQLLQLRKDIERRQQMVQVLNQQVNVVSTHLHNLELTQQGQTAQLPDSEEIASDAAAAEEMLAQLQADTELADSVAGVAATAGMTEEEQALYEELELETGQKSPDATATNDRTTATGASDAEPPSRTREPAKPQADPKRRAEPEAS